MKNKKTEIFVFNIFLISIFVVNFAFLTNLSQTSTSSQTNQLSGPFNQNFPNHSSLANENSKIVSPNTLSNSYSIKNNISYNLFFNSSITFRSITINATEQGDIAYFSLNQTSIGNNLLINALDEQNKTETIDYFEANPTDFLRGQITFPTSQFSTLNINASNTVINSTFNTILSLYFPTTGFDFQHPININDNETNIYYQALFPFESIYFKVSLQDNRRADFTINEIKTGILTNSKVAYYQFVPSSPTPSLIPDVAEINATGSYSYSWVSHKFIVSNDLYIEIKLDSGLTGNFSLLISYQETGYSLDSAINLNFNKSYTFSQDHIDRYVQSTFFKFEVNQSDIEINLQVVPTNPAVTTNSKFRIYYEKESNIFLDISSEQRVNESFIPTKGLGTYYIEYLPTFLPASGKFSITVSFINLPIFIWKFEFIIIDIFYFIVLPMLLFYFLMRNSADREKIDEWEVEKNYTEIFKIISKNQRLNPKMEVPYQKILLLRKNLFVRDIILDIVPVQIEEEEKRNYNTQNQTSIALRYKQLLDSTLSIILSGWIITFWIINIILYELTKTTVLPYRVTDLNSINNIIYYLTIPLVLVFLIILFFNESYVKNIADEIEYSISDITHEEPLRTGKTAALDNESVLKNLAYVRVLWNQSVKAFNEKNYSLFIIRADNAIKKLIETRFMQLIGSIDERLEFAEIIELIRNQGFDVPSVKKIEFFRKIRNKVVHSSHLLDEKTAIETFSYYSKFLNRLGLRT